MRVCLAIILTAFAIIAVIQIGLIGLVINIPYAEAYSNSKNSIKRIAKNC
jgi:hypothetical protein